MKLNLSSELDAQRWLPNVALLLAVFVCATVYWPGLNGPMLLDDFPQLGVFFHNGSAHAPGLNLVLWNNSGPLGRPVAMLSFWLNSLLTPDNLFAWKLTNLVIHCACGLLAGLLAMELFAVTPRKPGIEPRYLGAFVGIVWLLHPLQVSTVLYTVQRMEELTTLFTLAGLFAYVRARHHGPAAALQQTLWGLGWLSIMTMLAAFSKENGLLLPFIALAMEALLFRTSGTQGASRAIKLFFGSVLALSAVGTTVFFLLRPDFIVNGYAFRNFTLTQRLLTEPRILFDYLRMILLPVPGSMGFFHDDVVLSTGLLHPVTTAISLFGLVALAISAWFARRRFPLLALGVAIFLIGQSMESSVFALLPMFEHRNYLPSFGIFLAVTELLAWMFATRNQVMQMSVAGAMLLSLTLLLAVRVTHWSSSLSFYKSAAESHPHSDAAASGLAQSYLDVDRPQLALQALASHNSFGAALQRAYIECTTSGILPKTRLVALLEKPMGYLYSYPVTGLTELGALGIRGKCQFSNTAFSQLIDRAAQASSTARNLRYMLYIYSGYYHQRLNQLPQAIAAMQSAHNMEAGTPVPLILAARWNLQTGHLTAAFHWLEQAQIINGVYRAGFDKDLAQLGNQIENAKRQTASSHKAVTH